MKIKVYLILSTLLILMLGTSSTKQELKDFPVLTGPYLGQKPPGKTPEGFAINIFDSLYGFTNSVIVFSPDGKEAYWQARVRPEEPNVLGIAGIFVSRNIDGCWTEPQIAPFSQEKAEDNSPFISPDGKKLYFLTKRASGKIDNGQEIWVMDKTEKGWSQPRPLTSNVNSLNIRGQFSVDRQGNLYFAVWNTIPRYTELDIYCSRYKNGKYCDPEKLGPEVNQPERFTYSDSPFISPDASYLIFTMRTFDKCRLFISYRDKNGSWTKARDLSDALGEEMNCSNPFVTFDGKFLFFIRLSELDGEYPEGYGWVEAKFIEELRPPEME